MIGVADATHQASGYRSANQNLAGAFLHTSAVKIQRNKCQLRWQRPDLALIRYQRDDDWQRHKY
jgi:hypothetical protein